LVEGPTASKPKTSPDSPTDASTGDTDEEEFVSTQERLTQEADPERFDRTFLANKQSFRIGGEISSPSPFPLQALPRLAYVINYNVVYNEAKDRWEPQKKSSPTPTGSPSVSAFSTTRQNLPGGGKIQVSFDALTVETLDGFDLSNDRWVCPENGIYDIYFHAIADDVGFREIMVASILKNGTTVSKLIVTSPGFDLDITTNPSKVIECKKGDTVTFTVRTSTGSNNTFLRKGEDGLYCSIIKLESKA